MYGANMDPILDSQEVWRLLSQGVHEVAKVVARTYGPHGGKIAVRKPSGSVLVTTDGASLTREIQLRGPKNLGASMVRSAAIKTEEQVGDGTSTTVLLTDALLREIALVSCTPDFNPVALVNQIHEALEAAHTSVLELSRKADMEDLLRVARMASHEDEDIAKAVVDAVMDVGEKGSVVISAYEGVDIVSEHREGLVLSQGWASSEMASSESHERVMDGPLVAVFKAPLKKMADIASAMEQASQWPGRGLVVFAPQIYGEALSTLIVNDKKGVLSCAAVTYSGSPADLDDWLQDIASITNAKVVDPGVGDAFQDFKSEWLGYARKVTLTRETTTVISYMDGEILRRVDERIDHLRARAEATEFPFDRDRLTERASALDGGLVTLKVGGHTKHEAQDRRSRVEDTLRAVQTCLRSGVVPGAGMALFHASLWVPETKGGEVLARALRSIVGVLAWRAGLEPNVIIAQAFEATIYDMRGWSGFDPVKREWRPFDEDPRIVDPTEVVLVAVRNAVSIAVQIALCGGILPKAR